MKKILFLSFVMLFSVLDITNAKAGTQSEIVKTSLKKGRFETVQYKKEGTLVLLLDKYSGRVWRYEEKGELAGWVEVYRKMVYENKEILFSLDRNVTTKHNRFQLKFEDDGMLQCTLEDVDTGNVWMLEYNKEWEWVFNYIPRFE